VADIGDESENFLAHDKTIILLLTRDTAAKPRGQCKWYRPSRLKCDEPPRRDLRGSGIGGLRGSRARFTDVKYSSVRDVQGDR
jgi:hypothetical protein